MKCHLLKVWPHLFDEIATGRKTFDLRSTADRCFQAGDLVTFTAWDPVTGREVMGQPPISRSILAVYANVPGLLPGHVALSLGLRSYPESPGN